ncbi:MAG: hypothetical protein AAB567_03450 [Patescibacteria group bacterium]
METLIALIFIGLLIGLFLSPRRFIGCLGRCFLAFFSLLFLFSGIGHLFLLGNPVVGILFLGVGALIMFFMIRRKSP